MGKHIRVLTIYYDTEIKHKEIPLFRGAVLKSLGDRANVLYHNHTGKVTFRYSYPLIQYKRLNGKAAIVCVEEAIEFVGQILTELPDSIQIGSRKEYCHIDKIVSKEIDVSISNDLFSYHLVSWLPLNSRNYEQFQNADSLVERVEILQRVLTGNILSFLKGMDIRLEEQLEVRITDILNQKADMYKGVKMIAFDIKFKTNIQLPQYIGLGKNSSIGCGVLTKITN